MPSRLENLSPSHRKVTSTLENSQIISGIAADNRGVVSRQLLLKAGLGPSLIQKRVAAMRLNVLLPGVYTLGPSQLNLQARYQAAVLAGGPCAALSHRSAAALWGLIPPAGPIEILRSSSPDHPNSKLTGGPHGTSDRIVIHRSRVFGPSEYEIHNGIRTTTLARTFLDLASTMSFIELEAAFTEAERLGLVRMKEVQKMAARGRGWKGVGKLRRLIKTWNPDLRDTKSFLEIAFARLCQDQDIPLPEINVRVGNMEADCLWRKPALIVELDSYRHHSSRRAFERDRRKTRRFEKLGFRVLRLTYRMVIDEPDETAEAVRAHLHLARAP